MKKFFYLLMALAVSFSFQACSDDDDEIKDDIENGGGSGDNYGTLPVGINLQYPEGFAPQEGVEVVLKSTTNDFVTSAKTDVKGLASFKVPAGIYEASVTQELIKDNDYIILNGLNSAVEVDGKTASYSIKLSASKSSPVVIKELYFGGCLDNEGKKSFFNDKYVVLYNNSSATIDIQDYGFTMLMPYNATGANKDYENRSPRCPPRTALPSTARLTAF